MHAVAGHVGSRGYLEPKLVEIFRLRSSIALLVEPMEIWDVYRWTEDYLYIEERVPFLCANFALWWIAEEVLAEWRCDFHSLQVHEQDRLRDELDSQEELASPWLGEQSDQAEWSDRSLVHPKVCRIGQLVAFFRSQRCGGWPSRVWKPWTTCSLRQCS